MVCHRLCGDAGRPHAVLAAGDAAASHLVRHNAIRILVWLCVSGVFWIAGGLAEGEKRLYFWIVALAIEYVSAAARFWTPGSASSSVEAWAVEGGHMAERCSLFVIIALGKSIVVTGSTFAELTWSAQNIAAFVSALVGSIAMWWIYFHKGAEAGSEMISKSGNPAGWRGWPIPTCTCLLSPASFSQRSPMSWC